MGLFGVTGHEGMLSSDTCQASWLECVGYNRAGCLQCIWSQVGISSFTVVLLKGVLSHMVIDSACSGEICYLSEKLLP